MFTGIISALGEVCFVQIRPNRDLRLSIAAPEGFIAAQGGTAMGASIACSGCCLTVVDIGHDWFAVDVSAESLAHTHIGAWAPGTRINLERALRMGDELGGHLVSGHVDGVGQVMEVHPNGGSLRFTFAVPGPLARFIAPKGSVAVDGISLTVNEVGPDKFGVNIIPHTAANTTLGLRAAGDAVHIEIDLLARYVARLAETA